MKLTLVFDGLQFGGIERVGVEYIKLLRERGYDIEVINLNPSLRDLEKEIPKDVNCVHINYPRWISPQKYSKIKRKLPFIGTIVFYPFLWFFSLIDLVYKIFYKNKIGSTDIAIAFSGHWNDLTFVINTYKDVKKVAWLHDDQYSYEECSPGFFDLYKKIKNLICLSNYDDDNVVEFNRKYDINKVRIYNPINFSDRIVDENKVAELKGKYIDPVIMVGRLARDKDQRTLIKAMKVLRDEYKLDKYLLLVGDGTERKELEKLAMSLKLGDRVVFIGSVYDVQNFYSASALYVHSSPAEGFGLVLVEAMFYGLPVVSVDCLPGSREILGNDEYGLISEVGDEKALADNIAKMYLDNELREKYISKGKDRFKDFLPKTIIDSLVNYLEKLK